MIEFMRRRADLLPSMGIALGAALWGLFWIPLRGIEQAGVATAWTGPTIFACVSLVVLPAAVWRWRNFMAGGAGLFTAGALAGLAFALYASSILLTDVVRALLLFYMTPIWSTALGLAFLGERLTVNRVLALVLGFSGLAVILGAGVQFPWPRETGDWLALAAGLCWSFASVRLFQGGPTMVFEKAFLFVFCAFVASLFLTQLPLNVESEFPNAAALVGGWPWIAVVTIFLLPATYLTIWPTTMLSPARVGILFMAEVIVGVGSAASLTDEPFGTREALGTIFIVGAGIVEVLRRQDLSTRANTSR